jgi:hypothetical protein
MEENDFDLVKSFDLIKGPDVLTLDYEDISYFGFIDKSPIEARLIDKFDYLNIYDNYTKPYRAHTESKLLLGYCNGIINGERLYTTDIFPEFAGNDILLFFHYFSGSLLFYPITFDTSQVEKIEYKGKKILLHIENGMLIDAKY